ncbi:hypothetical protein CesoFtcFv8_007954 [Champsocephalus esox]|uniref:Uncharacterized protein n=1 Tax=Champsocephalus esox TaxID=159716 RepID=A0AAN8H5E0_9TELE|nr:hypothetical protein CesoFtcFv8_007954 [Champsocephalus esox]
MEKFSKMGVKQESSEGEEDGACGWLKDMSGEFMSAREARERLRESAVKMARDAGMSPSSAAFRAISKLDVNNNGGAHQPVAAAASVKTPKYSGKADWEIFHAQFELLAHAGGWSIEHPQSLQAASEMAVEREIVWSVAARSNGGPVPPAVRCCREEEKPVWFTEMTESVQFLLEEKMREMEAAVNAERELWQQQEARLKAELASLERDLQESKEKESLVASLERCLQEGKERERSLVEEGAKREAQFKELLRSLEAEKDNLEERLMNQLAQLNGSIADYQQEVADNREHLAELQREVERLARERAELEAEAQSESDRAARLRRT